MTGNGCEAHFHRSSVQHFTKKCCGLWRRLQRAETVFRKSVHTSVNAARTSACATPTSITDLFHFHQEVETALSLDSGGTALSKRTDLVERRHGCVAGE